MPTADERLEQLGSILKDRSSYGDFAMHAAFTQEVKAFYRRHYKWDEMPATFRHAIEMFIDKSSRELHGEHKDDNMLDAAGYALLAISEYK